MSDKECPKDLESIMASEESKAQYLAVYAEFMSVVFNSGWFASEMDRVTAMIAPYVQNDPTAFCTYEEFQTAVQTLRQFCLKRAESVNLQLDGQTANVDASELTISSMGGMGQGMGGGMEFPGGGKARPDGNENGESGFVGGREPSAGGTETEVQTAKKKPAMTSENRVFSNKSSEQNVKNRGEGRNIQPQASTQNSWIYLGLCAVLLCGALLVVCLYPNKR